MCVCVCDLLGMLDTAPAHARTPLQALMELGATVCRPVNPDCSACPARPVCRAAAEWTAYVEGGGDEGAEDAPRVTRVRCGRGMGPRGVAADGEAAVRKAQDGGESPRLVLEGTHGATNGGYVCTCTHVPARPPSAS